MADLDFLAALQAPNAADCALAARIDLRTGAVCAGVIAPRALHGFGRALREGRRAWSQAGYDAPCNIVTPPDAMERLGAEHLDDLARESGLKPSRTCFELDERAMVRHGPALAEGLRARGWGVALIGDPACPLPFGARARALYGEVVLTIPDALDPYLGLERYDDTPLGRRLCAAREAGMVLTARAASLAQARILRAAGFARAGGPCAALAA